MAKYSSDEIAERIREAQAGGWKALDLGALEDSDLRQLVRESGAERLASLDVALCGRITDAGVKALAEGCPSLKWLDLAWCRRVTDAGVKALAEGCPTLESLDLTACHKITDAGVEALAEGCQNLASLDLYACTKITDAGVRALAEGCASLESLDLGGCRKITDAGVKALVEGCLCLKSLDLSGCQKITDAAVNALAEGCPALKSLTLRECRKITDAAVNALAEGCPGLESLNLWDCRKITDAGVKELGEGCPSLESLNLVGCTNITDAGVKALAAACPGLKSLNLVWCRKITDAGVKALAAGCPSLKSLGLSSSRYTTDAAVEALAEGCPGLESLRLGSCKNMTDAGVRALAEGCPGLKSVNLPWGDSITDAAVKALAEGCPGLKSLGLWACERVTDGAVKVVAEGCASLESLSLSSCEHITDAAIKALAEGCRSLGSLVLARCRQVTLGGLGVLAKRLPPGGKLKQLHLRDNPQLGLPEEVIRGGDASRIVKAVREILAGAAEPLLEVKIVVLGDGAVGKTQLCNRLREEPFQEDSDRTADFEVNELSLSGIGPNGEEVAARLFDFGGQPHLWSAHRFFLASQRNLYVVVIDGARQGAKHLDYWLRYIRHYAGQTGAPEGRTEGDAPATSADRPTQAQRKIDIPVLAVVSKCDEAGFKELARLPRAVLRGWPRLKVVPRYSSKTDESLADVLSILREMVAGMDYVFTAQYPKALGKVKRWLEGSEGVRKELDAPEFARSLRVEQFDRVCALADEKAGTHRSGRDDAGGDYSLWLAILRNLGVVLWLGDLPQVVAGTALAEQVYHPDWVKTLTYGVIRHGLRHGLPQVVADAGLLKLLDRTWLEAQEGGRKESAGTLGAGEKRQLIDLMQACRLIFRGTAAQNQRWLVLDWIGDTRGVTTGAMQAESSRVTFHEFLPESFLVRFAGRWFRERSGLGDDLCRDQVVVGDPAYPNVKAVVRADPATRRLIIWTHDGTPDERIDVDGKVRGVIQRLADEEGLAWGEECWVQMEAERTEGMEYHLYPPFFAVEPRTSFADAWEVFCCEVLNLHQKTTQIRRRHAPEGGIDLLWQERAIAYQCKSVGSGRTGDFNVSKAIESIQTAIAHRDETGWREYWICTNVELTGPQEEKLRKVFPEVKLLTPSFWIPRCHEHHEHVYRRFHVLVPMKGRP